MKETNKTPWIILAACCGLACASVGISLNTAGIFYTAVCEDLHILRSSFSLHMTIFSLMMAIVSLWVPWIYQKLPVKPVMAAAALTGTLATAAMSLGRHVWTFYLLGGLRGASMCIISSVFLTMVINNWFFKSNGMATSVVFACMGLGGTLFSPLFSSVISHFGWKAGYLVNALCIGLLCLPSLLMPFAIDPQEIGCQPYGQKISLKAEADGESLPAASYKKAMGLMLVLAVFGAGLTSISQYFPGYTQTIGFGPSLGALMLSLAMLANVVGKLLIGILSDKIGAVYAVLVMVACSAGGLFLVISGFGSAGLLLGSFLFGGCYSVAAVGSVLLTTWLFGSRDYVKAYPLVALFCNVGCALSLPVIGLVYDLMGTYEMAWWMGFCFMAIYGICLLLACRLKQSVRNAKQPVLAQSS